MILGTATVAYKKVSPVSIKKSTVVAIPATGVIADGIDFSKIIVTLRDDNGNPVSGKTVSLENNSITSTIGAASGTSSDLGVVTFRVKNTVAEIVTYRATGDDVLIEDTATVAYKVGTVLSALSLYPNPAYNFTTLKAELSQPGNIEFQVIDLQGRLIKSDPPSYYQTRIEKELSVSTLPAGMYFIRVVYSSEGIKQFATIKLIKVN